MPINLQLIGQRYVVEFLLDPFLNQTISDCLT